MNNLSSSPDVYLLEVNLKKVIASTPLAVTATVLGVLVMVSNGLTLAVLLRSTMLTDEPRNMYLVNLLVLDIFGGAAFCLLGEFYSGVGIMITCTVFFNLHQWVYVSMLLNLILLMADQYVAIEFPLHYLRLSARRALYRLGVLVIWTVPCVHCVVLMEVVHGGAVCDDVPGNEDTYTFALYMLLALFAIPFPIAVTLNLRIIMIARRRAKEVSTLQVRCDTSEAIGGTNHHGIIGVLQNERRAFVAIWRSILTASIMLGTMLVTALPFIVISCQIVQKRRQSLVDTIDDLRLLSACFVAVSANYLCNPVIYAARRTEVKQFYLTLFQRIGCVK